MLRADAIWTILTTSMPRGEWVPLHEIYQLVETAAAPFSPEDLQPSAGGAKEPRWQRNVRNVLQSRKGGGQIEWDGDARYRLPAGVEGSATATAMVHSGRPPVPSDFEQVWEDLGKHLRKPLGSPLLTSEAIQSVRWTHSKGIEVRTHAGPFLLPPEVFRQVWDILGTHGWVSEDQLPQRLRDRSRLILGLLSYLDYVEQILHPRWSVFLVDREFPNKHVTSAFGVGSQGGIRYSGPATDPKHVLFLTSPPGEGEAGHPYRDRWEDGFLYYTGEGPTGDQVLNRGNLALKSAGEKEVPVYGFVRNPKGGLRYLGRFRVERVDEEQQPDRDGQTRRVYVFVMRPVQRRIPDSDKVDEPPTADLFGVARPVSPPPSLEKVFEVEHPPRDWDWSAAVGELVAFIEATGFVFQPWQVAAYVTALRTKPFVILAGISGTGKSRLPQLVARACGLQHELIPVRPDWTDSSDLLGYTDLSGRFRPGRLLRLARLAEENPNTGFVVVLDEMNLARVEHYFAEVLSRIEERLVDGARWSCKPVLSGVPVNGDAEASEHSWDHVCLPPNLALVGTVNMDESAHGFSRKVLDRAFTLELSETRLDQWRGERADVPSVRPWPAGVIIPCYTSLPAGSELKPEERQRVHDAIQALEEVNQSLRMAQLQVGYRVRDEVALFVVNALDLQDFFITAEGAVVDPLDLAIAMKVLPRIVGGSGAVRRVLVGLLGWATGEGQVDEDGADRIVDGWRGVGRPTSLPSAAHPHSAARLCLMWERLADDGFTSYWL